MKRSLPACAVAFAIAAAPVHVAAAAVVAPAAETAMFETWNKPVPALALRDMQGGARTLQHWRGKVLVVHFWATWCEPCVAELPALMRFRNELRNEPFEVVTVNLGEADTRIQNFYGKLGVDFITLLDRDGDARKLWQVGGVPMSFVLGADGRARYRYYGEIDWSSADVRAKVAALTREARRARQRDPAQHKAG